MNIKYVIFSRTAAFLPLLAAAAVFNPLPRRNSFGTLEICCGCGVFSDGCETVGFGRVDRHDILISKSMDLCSKSYVAGVKAGISAGIYDYVHFGTECTTWSHAAKPCYRHPSLKWILGHPTALRSKSKRLKILAANLMVAHTIEIMRHCWAKNVFTSLENPATSMMWQYPGERGGWSMAQLMACTGFVSFNTHYCAWGAPWRKATKILTNCGVLQAALERPCCGKRVHTTTLSGGVKVRVNGKTKWIARTKLANRYPSKLVKCWTETLACAVAARRQRRL